ncbi:MAG: Outer membrane protein assembly factor BamC [Candidatus Erwinia impunctatus]|nr:Outer membrane protein assembly factor BamC [Culicoides impunctatus]
MSYSVQKSLVASVVGLSLAMLLSSCSSDQRYKRQVSGDESYLQTTDVGDLRTPAGMILPLQNGDYDIPRVSNTSGLLGKQLDIRPPAQALALVDGARAQSTNNNSVLLFDNASGQRLWSEVQSIIEQQHFPVESRADDRQSLTTGWVHWQRADEDHQYQGRYQISVDQQGNQQALTVRLLDLKQEESQITSLIQLQRYRSQMMNALSTELDKREIQRRDAENNRNTGQLDVQSGADDTGLPLLIVRANFSTVWSRLPDALQRAGMKVSNKDRPQGSITLTYRAPDSWENLGGVDPELANGEYKLQVGDLDNRSSLQFIDPKGHTLSQSQNDALVKVFQAAFSK